MRLSLKGHLAHLARLATDPGFVRRRREIRRLEKLPRYTPTITTLLGKSFEITDALAFLEMHEEIWEQRTYSFTSQRKDPLILDGGANVGVSVAFFKALYPECSIIAFEPDPAIFAVLERNARRRDWSGVQLVPAALWTEKATMPFYSEGSYGGRLARKGDPPGPAVPTVRLRDYLDRPVDLLKLDIERGETEVLEDCAGKLDLVERVFVEHHSDASAPQDLPRLLSLLSAAGFRLNLHAGNDAPQPFAARKLNMGNDLQVEIFAFRETLPLNTRTDDPV